MGSKLWAVDMILQDYMQPMKHAAGLKDFYTAAFMLYDLNSFLVGYGSGIDDLPTPDNPTTIDVYDRTRPMDYFESYYKRYSPLLSQCMGQYVKTVLEMIHEEHQLVA